jgi:hypothetical protein
MFRKSILLLFSFLIISFSVVSCKENLPEVDMEDITKLLFEDVIKVWVTPDESSGFRELNQKEVKILYNSVKKGTNLSEVSNEEMSKVKRTVVFDIQWPKAHGGNLVFDVKTNKIYVYQETVFHNNIKEFRRKLIISGKDLSGGYCFQPSSEINKLTVKGK